MAVTLVAQTREGRMLRHVMDHEASVGRAESSDFVLPGSSVDKLHARLVHEDGQTTVVDLRSESGTFVNGRRIGEPTIVRDGDAVYIGDWRITIERAEHAAETVRAMVAARPVLPETVRAMVAAQPLMPDDEMPDTDRGDRTPTPLVPPPPDEPTPFEPRGERERTLFAAIAQTPADDALRQVYADWLEENGHHAEAELISLEREIRVGGERVDGQEHARLGYRLRQVARDVPLAWRAVVSRPSIEGCTEVHLTSVCPRSWDRLVPNGVLSRGCEKCARTVSFVETTAAAQERIAGGARVVVDVAAERYGGDLASAPGAPKSDVASVVELSFFARAEPPRTVADVLESLGVTPPEDIGEGNGMGFFVLPPLRGPDADRPAPLTALVDRLYIRYHFDPYHGGPTSTFEEIGYKRFESVSVSFRAGARAIDGWLRAHFGEPRSATPPPSSSGYPGTLHRIYGNWLLSHFGQDNVLGDGGASLEWVESLPEWAMAPTNTADALKWLSDLATLLRARCTFDELETFAARPPRQSGIVVTGRLNEEDFNLGFEPPLAARDVARAFGISDPIGASGDVHMSSWQIRERNPPTTGYPTCGPWAVSITLDGWPSGESLSGYASKELGAQDRARYLRVSRS